MCLSIITAVVLSLHGFFTNLTSGRFGVEVRETSHEMSGGSYGNKNKGTGTGTGSKKPFSRPHHSSGHSAHERGDNRLSSRENGSKTPGLRPDLLSKNKAWARHEEENDWSDRRSDGSQENIIRQTVTWQISRNSPNPRVEDEVQTLPGAQETRERNFLT